jgi:cytochrome c peroxidase
MLRRTGRFGPSLVIASCAIALCAIATHVVAADEYAWNLPRGWPAPVVPADNPMSAAKVELGCRLFFEPALSVNGTRSCATCHRPELAFTDGRARGVGATGEHLPRGSMSIANVAYSPALTWADDRLTTLEQQIERPLFNEHPVEMGVSRTEAHVLKRLAADGNYTAAFRAAFPSDSAPVSLINLQRAISAFERTLISANSAFDRYLLHDDREALSDDAREGMAVFFSARAGCAQCHSGPGFAGPIVSRERPTAAPAFARNGAFMASDADSGLALVSGLAKDAGRFRVPTLRNVAVTAPYMHDGRLTTLRDVLLHYATEPALAATRAASADIEPLSAGEQQLVIAFLNALTDEEFLQRDHARCSAPGGRS